jgi:ATP/ADP translocase
VQAHPDAVQVESDPAQVPDPPARSAFWSMRWLAVALKGLFALKRGDTQVLRLVAPLFGVVTAASVILATFTRAVFLTDHGVATLPWMFLGSSVFTVLVSIGYVAIIEKVTLRQRFVALLAIVEISFAILHLAYPLHPKIIALVQLIWCTGLANLVLVQTWNMTSALVPARQGKRLFPVLAAVSTLGAAIGGMGVSLLLKVIEARHLMWLVLALFAWTFYRIRGIIQDLERMDSSAEDHSAAMPAVRRSSSQSQVPTGNSSEIARGFRSIVDTPLLFRLAGLVFLLQIASLIIDFQFSSELKGRYTREEIAGFLGSYYAVSNSVAFFVALVATGRIVRIVGIGMSISASAVFVGLGSAAYFFAATSGYDWRFWAIVATSFFERIGQFALSRNAMQMLVMPLETRKGERAKTLIDGVVYRVATAGVSIVLLILAPKASGLGAYAPAAIAACIGAVAIGLSMGPHYRRALFEGLRARRLDADADPQTRALLVRSALGEVRQRLKNLDPREIVQALEMIKDMGLPITAEDLLPVARLADPELARRALEVMNDLGLKPERSLLLGLLTRDKPAGVLREGLRLLAQFPDKGLVPLVTQFVAHPDAGVARLAVVWLKNVGGEQQTAKINAELLDDLKSAVAERRARATFISGGYTIDAALDLSAMLDDPSPEVRQNAVESMGQIGSPEFIGPLIKALGKAELVPAASASLLRYGAPLLPSMRDMLATGPAVAVQMRLLRIVERIGTPEAVALLMEQAEHALGLVRNNAILSLWRLARDPDKPRPPRSWVHARVRSEIDRLRRYQSIEQRAFGMTSRHTFFLSELQALRLQAEGRCFRMLGLLHSRAAMHKAYLYYRSPQQRVRSTAIELLDQHLVDPDLKAFVALVERGESTSVVMQAQDSHAMRFDTSATGGYNPGAEALRQELAKVEPWLGRAWQWTLLGQAPRISQVRKTLGEALARDPMDMVFVLKGVPLLSDLSGEQLLPLADVVQTVHVEAGDLVFEEGEPGNHLYVILDGEVEVIHGGERVAQLGVKECFGEMALLDQSARSASVRALKPVELLALARDDFQDLLDLNPALARGVIRVLVQRLRVATETVAEEKAN